MKVLAEALIYAIQHIETNQSSNPDSDVAALEAICAALHSATAEEKSIFELEAKRLGYPELPENLGIYQ